MDYLRGGFSKALVITEILKWVIRSEEGNVCGICWELTLGCHVISWEGGMRPWWKFKFRCSFMDVPPLPWAEWKPHSVFFQQRRQSLVSTSFAFRPMWRLRPIHHGLIVITLCPTVDYNSWGYFRTWGHGEKHYDLRGCRKRCNNHTHLGRMGVLCSCTYTEPRPRECKTYNCSVSHKGNILNSRKRFIYRSTDSV